MLLAQLGIGDAAETTASVHAHFKELNRVKWETPGSDVDADGFESSDRTREGFQPSVHMSEASLVLAWYDFSSDVSS